MADKVLTPENQPTLKKKKKLRERPAFTSIVSSLISTLIGLLIGLVVVVCINPSEAFSAYGNFLIYGFSTQSNIAQFLYKTAPYLMTGLAVAFCFKAGSFNIGGPGQYLVGGVCAYLSAVMLKMPWYVSLLLAVVGGGLMGFLPGFLKAVFNVNEVLSAIMLNWLSLICMNWLLKTLGFYYSSNLKGVTTLNNAANAIIPSWGLESFDSHFTIAVFIGIIIAVFCWVILEKTNFGFEIKACGLNRDAAKYAGIKSKRTLIAAFAISGALAGLGGAFYILMPAGSNQGFADTYNDLNKVAGLGFDGISVALLASNNPIGCIFSAVFISYIKLSSSGLAPHFNKNVGDIVIGVIVYCASFIALIRLLISGGYIKKRKKPASAEAINPAPAVSQTQEAPVLKAEEEKKEEKPSDSAQVKQEEKPVEKPTPVAPVAEEKKPAEVKKEEGISPKKEETAAKKEEERQPNPLFRAESEKKVATPQEMEVLIKKLASEVPVKETENEDLERQKQEAMNKKETDFKIERSPYQRDELDGYNQNSAMNVDDAQLTRTEKKADKGDR